MFSVSNCVYYIHNSLFESLVRYKIVKCVLYRTIEAENHGHAKYVRVEFRSVSGHLSQPSVADVCGEWQE